MNLAPRQMPRTPNTRPARAVIAFSLWEKAPDRATPKRSFSFAQARGRMRGLRPEAYAPAVHTRTSNPLIRRKRATFSQKEKADPFPPCVT